MYYAKCSIALVSISGTKVRYYISHTLPHLIKDIYFLVRDTSYVKWTLGLSIVNHALILLAIKSVFSPILELNILIWIECKIVPRSTFNTD